MAYVLSYDVPDNKSALVKSIAFRALSEFSQITKVEVSEATTERPNFIIMIMNDTLVAELRQPEYEILGFTEGSNLKRAYNDRSCSGTYFAAPISELRADEAQEIILAAIQVHHSLKGEELQLCIYEEVAAVIGLSNDPPSLPSLFSEGNFNNSFGTISYGDKVLLMFQALYEITAGSFDDIQAFCTKHECPDHF